MVAKAQDADAAGYAALLAQSVAHVPGWDEKNFQVSMACWPDEPPVHCIAAFALKGASRLLLGWLLWLSFEQSRRSAWLGSMTVRLVQLTK